MSKVKDFKNEEGCVKIILENHSDVDMYMLEMIHKEIKALPCLPMKHEIGTFLYDTTQYISLHDLCDLWEFTQKDINDFLRKLFVNLSNMETTYPYVLHVDAIFFDATREHMRVVVLPIHEHVNDENDWSTFILELLKILQVQDDARLGWLYRLSQQPLFKAQDVVRAWELYMEEEKQKHSISYMFKRKRLWKHFDANNFAKLKQYFSKQTFILKSKEEGQEQVQDQSSPPRTNTVALFPSVNTAYLEQDKKRKAIAQVCKIGRGEECDYILSSLAVSLQHACIEQKDEMWWITDLKSSNGSSVNQQPLIAHTPIVLHHQDNIQIADVSLIFYEEQAYG